MNLAVWVERHGRRRPDDPALADGERVHAGWAELAARTAGAAAGLRDDLGLAPGERVAIAMRSRPEYLEALLAIWQAGLVAVPVNARLHRDEITMPLIWPPFKDVPVAKTLDDLKRLKEEIMPRVDAM